MKIKIDSFVLALLPLILGLIVGYLITPKEDLQYKTVLEDQLESAIQKAENAEKSYDSLKTKFFVALESIESARDSLTIESEKSKFYKSRYEKAKHSPVVIAGQSQLDSLLRARYPSYRYLKGR